MSKVTVELDDDAVDSVVVQALKNQYNSLTDELEYRKDDRETIGIFYKDKEKDIAEIQRHLEAVATVLVYNMTHKDFEEWQKQNER